VWGWGGNAFGQAGGAVGSNFAEAPARVGTLTKVRSIAAGEDFSVALRADGTIWTWGRGDRGQLGNGALAGNPTPTQVPGLPAMVAIAAGAAHVIAIAVDNTVWGWGANEVCELGGAPAASQATPAQIGGFGGGPAQVIAASAYASFVITAAGDVWAWGSNASGELGQGGGGGSSCTPVKVPLPEAASQIAAGSAHVLALDGFGTLRGWGDNSRGAVGRVVGPDAAPQAFASGVDEIAAGGVTSLWRLSDGRVFGRGFGSWGELGPNGLRQQAGDPNLFLAVP